MTKYKIIKVENGFRVLITTYYRTHDVYITNELRELRDYYYLQNQKDKTRLYGQWKSAERVRAFEITNENETGLSKIDTYVLCDLALSQAIVNMIDDVKGVKQYGL